MDNSNVDQQAILDTGFAKDIFEGLTSKQKRLFSKYFYDEIGDNLFQQIMELDEYYLTKTEYNILDQYKSNILEEFVSKGDFHLFELGAGDGYKTKILLRYFTEKKISFIYNPIDISSNVLQQLELSLAAEMKNLNVLPLQGDYFDVLKRIDSVDHLRKVVLFLGSNIGNFHAEEAEDFLKKLRKNLNKGDLLLIGIDLKKDPEKILNAYNDRAGVTRDFNLNLLRRINTELCADFDLEQFMHYPYYNPTTGECRSYLLSKENQTVSIELLDLEVKFKKWEAIHMEISKKYDLDEIAEMAGASGFNVSANYLDGNGYFVNSLWEAI